MSEFKFACPVCGQHMMCDTSHGGSVMECPTCFQKIVAPQAPAPDAKFILTGTKLADKKPVVHGQNTTTIAPQKSFPLALVFGLALVVAAAGAGFFLYQTRSVKNPADKPATKNVTKAKPSVVAPPASDTNWMLSLDQAVIPGSPAAGRIHGHDFIVERAFFQNGTLTLRDALRGAMEFGVQINFKGAEAESLAGKVINVSADTDAAAPITLRWKNDGSTVQKEVYTSGYALRLEFDPLANNRLRGKIYLCTPDPDKSYLMGTLNADVRKPKPKAPPK